MPKACLLNIASWSRVPIIGPDACASVDVSPRRPSYCRVQIVKPLAKMAFKSYSSRGINRSQIFLPNSSNSTPEYWTFDFHVDVVEWAHDSLDPILIDFRKELFDCLLRLRWRWVRSYRCTGSGGVCGRRLRRSMKEKEFDIWTFVRSRCAAVKGTLTSTGHEAGNVIVVETIDAFEIPVSSCQYI